MRALLLPLLQILLSVLFTTAILLQQQGTGLGMAFGGEGNAFRTKRGLEKSLFYVSIGLGILFFVTAIINVALA